MKTLFHFSSGTNFFTKKTFTCHLVVHSNDGSDLTVSRYRFEGSNSIEATNLWDWAGGDPHWSMVLGKGVLTFQQVDGWIFGSCQNTIRVDSEG